MSLAYNTFNFNSIEIYRDSLLKPIKRSVTRLIKKNEAKDCAHQLGEVFALWKNEHGEAVPKNQFLRHLSKAADKFRARLTHADFDFEDLEPYQCAGYGIKNYTDLAFKLWLDDYTPFTSLCEMYQTDRVLAAANYFFDRGDSELDHMDSLIRLSCHIYEMEVFIFKHMTKSYRNKYLKEQKVKSHTGLTDEARQSGADANRFKSEQAKIQFRNIGIEIWRETPRFKYENIAYELFTNHNMPKNRSGDNYSQPCIRKFIVGIKKEL